MIKRGLKSNFGFLLLAFLATGLTISTLHSHHNLELHHHHPEEFADTGNCISPDTTHCPICGYLFNSYEPAPAFGNTVFFSSDRFNIEKTCLPVSIFKVVNKGRSPPISG